MNQPPIYGQAAAATGYNPGPTEGYVPRAEDAVNADDPRMQNIEAQVEALVAAKLSDVESKYADRIKALEGQLEAMKSQLPAHLVPEHAGGPGYELADTWSQWHQELARAGLLTEEHLAAVGMSR